MNFKGETRHVEEQCFEFDLPVEDLPHRICGTDWVSREPIRINGLPVRMIQQTQEMDRHSMTIRGIFQYIPVEQEGVLRAPPRTEDRVTQLENRIEELETQIAELKKCDHDYETVGGRNTNHRVYYSGAFAHIKCTKCGQRTRT